MLKFNPFKSLTVAGVLGAAGTVLVTHYDPAALSPALQGVMLALSIVVGGLGLRNSVAKTGAEILQQLTAKR